MEFNFPFPSLKQLSIITVCQHWSDNNLGLFSEIREESTVDSKSIYPLFEKYDYMVKQLSIPAELKPAVCEVLYGICLQLHDWAHDFSYFSSVEKFYFDSFGRFDLDRTIERFYKNEVTSVEDLSALRELLSEAAGNAWLSKMDMVLRKMVAVVLQPVDVPLVGPSCDVQDDIFALVMRYTFVQNLDSTTVDKLKCLTSLIADGVLINVNEKGLVIESIVMCWSMEKLETLCSLYKSVEGAVMDCFVKDSFPREYIPTSYLLQGLTSIEKENKYKWFSYVSENCKESMHLFLKRLLVWPYTMHFIPAFKLMYPYLGRSTLLNLFYGILVMMFSQRLCGMLHGDLLMEFFSVLSVSEKIWCAAHYMEKAGRVFLLAMRDVGSGKKAMLIHNAIMADLNALPKECPRWRLQKRKHE